VFGRVVKGMNVVDQIKDGVTGDRPDVIVDGEGMQNVPLAPVVILSVSRITGPTASIDEGTSRARSTRLMRNGRHATKACSELFGR